MSDDPAFPTYPAHWRGMTLRDYFAVKAMLGLMGDPELDRLGDVPEYAYRIADAMLKARDA